MKEEILDRRVRKTRRQLKECLTRLLKEKKIQDITVRELAEMADINRGTFYLHYKDVFDLMDQIKNDLVEEVESVLDAPSRSRTGSAPFPRTLRTISSCTGKCRDCFLS